MQTDLKLILLGDCCSGVPGHRHETNFRAVTEALVRHGADADALCFLGDHVSGYVAEERELRSQWTWFLEREFPLLKAAAPRVFHIPGNHDCYDAMSRRVYQELFAVSDCQDVVARKELNYAVRLGRALLVFLNTADIDIRGDAGMDLNWLGDILNDFRDAELKLVFGHHPVLPVNGYDDPFKWCVEPATSAAAWRMFLEHGVKAYICSHIIAFDFQMRDGVAQLCSGGAGTEYGPMGAMPGPEEYQHFVTFEAGPQHLRFRAFDKSGSLREYLG